MAPKRADIQQLRAQYFAKTGDKKREMEAYELLLGALGEDEGPVYAHIAAMLARVCSTWSCDGCQPIRRDY